jgi:hypothetical protein
MPKYAVEHALFEVSLPKTWSSWEPISLSMPLFYRQKTMAAVASDLPVMELTRTAQRTDLQFTSGRDIDVLPHPILDRVFMFQSIIFDPD